MEIGFFQGLFLSFRKHIHFTIFVYQGFEYVCSLHEVTRVKDHSAQMAAVMCQLKFEQTFCVSSPCLVHLASTISK